jgi:DNA-binding XRE family transcriptional regulator
MSTVAHDIIVLAVVFGSLAAWTGILILVDTKGVTMATVETAVGDRIRRVREEQGLSQRELSSPGVSYAYISRIEAGARRPSLRALIRLAEKLDTTGLFLLTGRAGGTCPLCGRRG